MRRSFDILQLAQAYALRYVDAMNSLVLVTDLWQKASHEQEPHSSPSNATTRTQKPATKFTSRIADKVKKLCCKMQPKDFSQIAPLN